MTTARRSILLFAIGLFLMVGGFFYDVIFAGIPYQDPTPEMQASYDQHASIASLIRWSGVALLLAGCLYLLLRRFARRS